MLWAAQDIANLPNLVFFHLSRPVLQVYEIRAALEDDMTAPGATLDKTKVAEQMAEIVESNIGIAPTGHHLFENLIRLAHANRNCGNSIAWETQSDARCHFVYWLTQLPRQRREPEDGAGIGEPVFAHRTVADALVIKGTSKDSQFPGAAGRMAGSHA